MFERYAAIWKANKKYYEAATEGVSTAADLLNQDSNTEHENLRAEMLDLLTALPGEEMVELTGIVLFGRDANEWQDSAQAELNRYIQQHAYMAKERGHAVYLGTKPIYLYLDRAEAKLIGPSAAKPLLHLENMDQEVDETTYE